VWSMESVFFLCLTQHVEGRFIVHDLTISSIEILVNAFYTVIAARSVLFLSRAVTLSCAETCRHSVLWLVYLLIFFILCVSE